MFLSIYSLRAVWRDAPVVFLLYFGAPFFHPLFVSLLIAYALSPVVNAVTTSRAPSWSLPRSAVAASPRLFEHDMAWADDATPVDRAPAGAKALSRSLQKYVRRAVQPCEVKKAAADLESVAQTGRPPRPPPATPARQHRIHARVSLVDRDGEGGKNVALAGAQVISVLFLVFFMLSGDLFQRRSCAAIAAERNRSDSRCGHLAEIVTRRCAATCSCSSYQHARRHRRENRVHRARRELRGHVGRRDRGGVAHRTLLRTGARIAPSADLVAGFFAVRRAGSLRAHGVGSSILVAALVGSSCNHGS